MRTLTKIIALIAAAAVFLPTGAGAGTFRFGLLLVGPYNDRGWSQAHYEAGRRIEKELPGTEMIYIDKVNPADRPGVTIPQLVDDMVEKGCRLIIANSDDMKDGIVEAALEHPDVYFVHVSGDHVLAGNAPKNLSNLMGRMEYAKMMAGFVAALTTRTGKIGYLGPLINDETRRLAVSSYLGARYAWEHVRKRPASELKFRVNWIGFWFNIPGVTADPTQVAQNFFNSGYDVLVSGIDTTEAVVVAQQKRKEGKEVWAVPYDYAGACEGAGDVCLGVPYFNWFPGYKMLIQQAMAGKWKSQWLWLGPDWKDINDQETSSVGFLPGPALSADVRAQLDAFVRDLGAGKVNLFQGPLNYQDGSPFLAAGQAATDKQIWYMKQLLQGMEGQSSAK
ncbi:BMP family lipoprotein [Deferrisoma camini]|uniref:BMP family lipoprotein n=1 Tax=Deferrisoma camini TaxID=1035120 RepID=UPI00046D741E|nr:BMP family ABC transporter substrate-binding protein [Deferrisoma camini]